MVNTTNSSAEKMFNRSKSTHLENIWIVFSHFLKVGNILDTELQCSAVQSIEVKSSAVEYSAVEYRVTERNEVQRSAVQHAKPNERNTTK